MKTTYNFIEELRVQIKNSITKINKEIKDGKLIPYSKEQIKHDEENNEAEQIDNQKQADDAEKDNHHDSGDDASLHSSNDKSSL